MAELACDSISVRFGGILALQSVDLIVPESKVTGLIGPNGAGKTTLFNVMTGIQPPREGRILLDGIDITRQRPARRAKRGLARTFQKLELFGTLTTRENILMAAETQEAKLPRGVSPQDRTEFLIDKVGLGAIADETTDSLPTGQARLVELARALATSPSVLLLDEPSAGLDHAETSALGEILLGLADDGLAVLLVEHDMDLVMGVCHSVHVLDFGTVIASGDPASIGSNQAVQTAYLGANRNDQGVGGRTPGRIGMDKKYRHGSGDPQSDSGIDESPKPLLALDNIRAGYGRLEVIHGASLEIPRGSITAILGPNGAGKSTLLKVASGLLPVSSGTAIFDGRSIGSESPERMARIGLCTIPEGRAVFPNLTVAENLRMYTYRGPSVDLRNLEQQTYERFPVLGARRKQLAGQLSGGEQQMLALSRALYTKPQLLMLDELSMGLAPMIVDQLYAAVMQLVKEEKLTVLLVEQFATTALSIADFACLMVTGEVVKHGSPHLIGEHLTESYLGVSPSS
jgi:branched-chain amino acid transport system ATP-binding protein